MTSSQVWDGTRCPWTLLKVIVEPDVTEGPSSFSKEKENLIANVLAYDNHVEFARQLKVREKFLREINLYVVVIFEPIPVINISMENKCVFVFTQQLNSGVT